MDVERLAFERDRDGEPADDIAAAVETMPKDEGSFALVAEQDGEVVGHIQFSRAWVGDYPVVLLGPIGVRPDRQRNGIGSALIHSGLAEARARGERAVILLGDPNFYSRFGFVAASRFGLRNPAAGVQANGFVVREEDFQIAPLDSRADSLAGAVRWDPALK